MRSILWAAVGLVIIVFISLSLRCNYLNKRYESLKTEYDSYRAEVTRKQLDRQIGLNSVVSTVQNEAVVADRKGVEDAKMVDRASYDVAIVNCRVRSQYTDTRNTVDTGCSCECSAAKDTIRMYSDMFGECASTVTEVAKYADAARRAGVACERGWDSMKLVK